MSEKNPTPSEFYQLLSGIEDKMTHRFDRLEDKINESYMPRKEIEKEFHRLDVDISELSDEVSGSQRKIIGIAASLSSVLTAVALWIINEITNGGM